MTKRKPSPVAAHIAHVTPARGPRAWGLTTYIQWLPVLSVAVGGIIWLTRLQDDVQGLKTGASQADIVSLKDQINSVAKDEGKLEVKEGNDFAEAKANTQQIWQYIGQRKENAKP